MKEDIEGVLPTGLEAPRNENSQGEPLEFCPDLIVPDGNECCLEVSVQAAASSFAITDPAGQVVLQVMSEERPGVPLPPAAGRQGQCFALVVSGAPVARCVAAGEEFHMLTPSGERFASLRPRGRTGARSQSYVLTTKTGARWEFSGSFDHHAVDVMDMTDTQRSSHIAKTELSRAGHHGGSEQYTLRVGPGRDVGLVLCGLLCIDHLSR